MRWSGTPELEDGRVVQHLMIEILCEFHFTTRLSYVLKATLRRLVLHIGSHR
jgi:hypothetical protein